ncbi:stationary phase survival protein SurE [Pedobacter montanisoli]|uniref:Stationary phase survival protein SurE n=1 Tax=Pedobacter montanisoli TaxID=2923277 RepID=A0ABS9ZVH1_9SPHI|nr:stationary phase survival protein SurE [Pedobacter montanisoli]MCJ0742343.1 stationary phase survival protein SurE [Pedobacter montanisoli]
MSLIAKLKNSVWIGLGVGFAIPCVLVSIAWYLMHHVKALKEADLLLIGCVAVNAFLMNYFFKVNKEHVARGILAVTFLWAFAFFIYKLMQEINVAS